MLRFVKTHFKSWTDIIKYSKWLIKRFLIMLIFLPSLAANPVLAMFFLSCKTKGLSAVSFKV